MLREAGLVICSLVLLVFAAGCGDAPDPSDSAPSQKASIPEPEDDAPEANEEEQEEQQGPEDEQASECTKGELDQSVSVSTQAALEEYRGYTKVRWLTIQSDVTSLEPLHCLEAIDQNLEIWSSKLVNLNGLENLTTLGAMLLIDGNADLEDVMGILNIEEWDFAWVEIYGSPHVPACQLAALIESWTDSGLNKDSITFDVDPSVEPCY